jgi:hypothetical protein
MSITFGYFELPFWGFPDVAPVGSAGHVLKSGGQRHRSCSAEQVRDKHMSSGPTSDSPSLRVLL